MIKLEDKVSFFNYAKDNIVRKDFAFNEARYYKSEPRHPSICRDLNTSEVVLITNSQSQHYALKDLLEKLKQKQFVIHYGEGPIYSDYPKFHYFGLNYIIDSEHSTETQLAWGYCLPGDDVEVAIAKALGEALERQASYYTPTVTKLKLPRIYQGDASFLTKLIPHFLGNTTKQTQDVSRVWGFKAKSLTGDWKKFFPLECFYWGARKSADQPLLFHPTTSGSGAGTTKEKALLSAWYELIERDHFLLYWLSGAQPDIIENSSLPQELKDYVESCEKRYGLEVYFLDLDYDLGVSVRSCVLIDPILNRITMGAKAGPNTVELYKGALLEALAVLTSTRSFKKSISETELKAILAEKPFSQHITREARVNLYASKFGIDLIKSIYLSGQRKKIPTVDNVSKNTPDKANLESLILNFKNLVKKNGSGYHAYYHFFSSPWLKELNYHSAHIFVPSLLKLHLNEFFATPNSPRLDQFAVDKKIDINGRVKINGVPHFFP